MRFNNIWKGLGRGPYWQGVGGMNSVGRELVGTRHIFFGLNGLASWMGVGHRIVRSFGLSEIGLRWAHTQGPVRAHWELVHWATGDMTFDVWNSSVPQVGAH